MTSSQKVLQTILYADIFSYPLTEDEVNRWLITSEVRHISSLLLDTLVKEKRLVKKENYYLLPKKVGIVKLRKEREQSSMKKLGVALKISSFLKLIPTIKMVAVTGSLAMMNTPEEEDIDFLIVTQEKRLWLTRLLTTLLVALTGRRRRPKETQVKNKICLNMFLEESHLAVPGKERDLFTAHEVLQLRPLWERNHLYQKFLEENQWVKKYLANWSR